jgi:hypothetical protein
MPVVPFALIGLVEFYAEVTYEPPHNGGPGLVIGVAIIIIAIAIVSVPVIGMLQWLIVRRTWATPLLLPGWLLSTIICLVAFVIFRGMLWIPLGLLAVLPTLLLTYASPPGLRLRAFSVLLASFAIGAALAWTMLEIYWPGLGFYQRAAHSVIAQGMLRLCLSVLVAAAVSGAGLWIVSRWICGWAVKRG